MSRAGDKTELPLATGLREILRMAVPVILAVASVTVMQFVDFFMVAKLGEAQTAAVTPAGMLVFTVISFLIGVLSCNSTFVSQSHAKGNLEDCARYTWQSIYIAGIGGAVSLVLWPAAPELFRLIGHDPKLQEYEVVFFRISLFSVGTAAAGAGLGAFFQAVGRPMILMWVAIEANILNIFLNYALIFGKFGFPEMGIAGSALGTVIAVAVQVAILMAVFLNGDYAREYRSRHTWQWDGKRIKGLFRIGWAAGAQFVLDISCWGVFTALVVGRIGLKELAASNIASQIMRLSFMPTIGLGLATTALVGQKIGKGEIGQARALARTSIRLGMAYMFSMGVLFLIFRKPLIGFFQSTPDAQVVLLGSQVLILAAAFQLFDAVGIVCSGALKGAGDTKFPAVMQVLYAWVIFLPASWLLTYRLQWGLAGAWTAACVFVVILGITLMWRWNSRSWESIDIFGEKPVVAAGEIAGAMLLYEPREEMIEIGATGGTEKKERHPNAAPEEEE